MSTPLGIINRDRFGGEVFSLIEVLESSASVLGPTGFISEVSSAADLDRVDAIRSQVVESVDDPTRRTEPFTGGLATGSATVRETIAGLLAQSPVTYPVIVHPDTTMGRDVRLSEGVVVAAGSRLSTNIQVGRHVHIDQNAVVGHDCNLGDVSRLNPQACVSGAVTIGRRALIGANATVLQGLDLSDDAVVGAGAVVTLPVGAATTVKGVPAR